MTRASYGVSETTAYMDKCEHEKGEVSDDRSTWAGQDGNSDKHVTHWQMCAGERDKFE